jgi:hypothetical protein
VQQCFGAPPSFANGLVRLKATIKMRNTVDEAVVAPANAAVGALGSSNELGRCVRVSIIQQNRAAAALTCIQSKEAVFCGCQRSCAHNSRGEHRARSSWTTTREAKQDAPFCVAAVGPHWMLQ